MSGKALGWAFEQSVALKLSPTQRFVLVAIADNADTFGRAWPSKKELARKTGYDLATVYRALKVLDDYELFEEAEINGRETFLLSLPANEDSQAAKDDSQAAKSSTYSEPPVEPPVEPGALSDDARSRALRLCQWLTETAEEEPRTSYTETQIAAADWLLDNVAHAELRDAVQWAHTRSFWASQVRTAGRIKQRWADLRADWRAATKQNGNGKGSVGSSPDDLRAMAEEAEKQEGSS